MLYIYRQCRHMGCRVANRQQYDALYI
jgi:hypothetical protein